MTVINYILTFSEVFSGELDASLGYIPTGKLYYFLLGEDLSPTMWGTDLPKWNGATFEPLFTLAAVENSVLRHREEWLSRKVAYHQEAFLDEVGNPEEHMNAIAHYCEQLDLLRLTSQVRV